MRSAYHELFIYNLQVIKKATRWRKHDLINQEQLLAIKGAYQTPLFHPNFAIRILLFLATLLASSGVNGLFMLFFEEFGDTALFVFFIALGVLAFVLLEKVFIANKHFQSGVTDAITYLACGFIIGGVGGLMDFDNIFLIQLTCLLVFAFAAYRYLDIVITFAFVITLGWIIFYNSYEAGGVFKSIIPFLFIITFSILYFVTRSLTKNRKLRLWSNNLLVLESCSLLLIYAGGNYYVVRELTINLMEFTLQPGDDIPFAWLFYFFTVSIPALYLIAGIRSKSVVLIRFGILTLALSIATFKYYFLPDYTEVFLLIVGAVSILLAIILIRYLKQIRNGFTSDNIVSSAWADVHAEAFIVSQTLGGNQIENTASPESGGGGSFGGGGSTDSF